MCAIGLAGEWFKLEAPIQELIPMASEWTQEAVLRFLADRGGRVRNVDLTDHFRSTIPTDHLSRTAAKDAFKRCVDSIAFVKVENGEKYVCLKKKFRGSVKRSDERSCNGHVRNSGAIVKAQRRTVNGDSRTDVVPVRLCEKRDEPKIALSQCCAETTKTDEDEDAKQDLLPGSGYGTGGDAQPPLRISESVSLGIKAESRVSKPEMGNQLTDNGGTVNEPDRETSETLQASQPLASEMSIPESLVTDECVLPAVTGETVFGQSARLPTDCPALSGSDLVSDLRLTEEETAARKGSHCCRRRQSRGSQRSNQSEGGVDEGHLDFVITSGSDSNTPKGSRKSFIEHMMNSSPQVRRSMVLRNSVHLSARYKDSSGTGDGDSASVNSCSVDDENAVVTLDPLEHEWMMCASDGQWESLHRLLTSEPNLISKKDFVTGFTCFHWAAKQGKPELLAVLVNFAKQHEVAVNINARSSAGYTPLHLAAMHNHIEVVKLLVGAYDADVEVRDYSGKKAGQYLRSDVARDIFDIIGAGDDWDAVDAGVAVTGRWRLSKLLQSNLRPLKLLNQGLGEGDACDNAGVAKPLRRKASLNKFKPRLSKIVHSTSLFERLEREAGEASGSVKSRPKSNLFG
ncbi:ankyrin repeat domain-containing protein SOWAHC-like [Electrophorus electricus]|uniref:ankyrin repeat domain-containing protein SOWAHC-like n=1 Tax=Electrophorus electricus TaxID=8005 RepID=UPI0015CFB3B3|nr:ankyrin repeat domain-containing protein SOWAHC-like [Electrophorus electricus]